MVMPLFSLPPPTSKELMQKYSGHDGLVERLIKDKVGLVLGVHTFILKIDGTIAPYGKPLTPKTCFWRSTVEKQNHIQNSQGCQTPICI